MDDSVQFEKESNNRIEMQGNDLHLQRTSLNWLMETAPYQYSYNYKWMGRPIIQLPQDILAMQELIWSIKPDLVIETGVARGGSVVFYASMMELLGNGGKVIGIDIDIREHNRAEIEKHPMYKNIHLIEGSSTDLAIVGSINDYIKKNRCEKILVALDSDHAHEHVLEELRLYSPFVKKGSYIVVFDTAIEDMPQSYFNDKPWGKGSNAKTAVYSFLKENKRFEIDKKIDAKLLISVAPDGYLKCIK